MRIARSLPKGSFVGAGETSKQLPEGSEGGQKEAREQARKENVDGKGDPESGLV